MRWALDWIVASSDSDLFPASPELELLAAQPDQLISDLTGTDLSALLIGASQHFLIPKDELSFRRATALDPQDSLILAALVHQFGGGIEDRRLDDSRVFSYRFAPSESGLYSAESGWNDFWNTAEMVSRSAQRVVYCDVADFYNQVSHHTLENQMTESGIPKGGVDWIKKLIQSTTAGVSRGIPVGPHAVHLLAEATLIPIDNALEANGVRFVRYVDDFVAFADSDADARRVLATVAKTLDRQQGLLPQRHKTRIFESEEFAEYARHKNVDQPVSAEEDAVLGVVQKYSKDPYAFVARNRVDDDDWEAISNERMEEIVLTRLQESEVDYPRLAWLFRRMSQIGHPGAAKIVLKNLDRLVPCMSSVVKYLGSLQMLEKDAWLEIGDDLLRLATDPEMDDLEYFQLLLLSLFARNPALNHFSSLAGKYSTAPVTVRRQILLAASASEQNDWLREFKQDFMSLDSGQRLAFMWSLRKFPADERKYAAGLIKKSLNRPLEMALLECVKNWRGEDHSTLRVTPPF